MRASKSASLPPGQAVTVSQQALQLEVLSHCSVTVTRAMRHATAAFPGQQPLYYQDPVTVIWIHARAGKSLAPNSPQDPGKSKALQKGGSHNAPQVEAAIDPGSGVEDSQSQSQHNSSARRQPVVLCRNTALDDTTAELSAVDGQNYEQDPDNTPLFPSG